MSRTYDRKPTLRLETLERRNLQSALSLGSNLGGSVNPPSALISPSPTQLHVDLGAHGYHGVTGFFGQ